MRDKSIPLNQFTAVQQYDWKPVELAESYQPNFVQNMPSGLVAGVFASGSSANGIPVYDTRYGSGVLVGGLEVVRYSPDDPVPYNKDCYSAVSEWKSGEITLQGPWRRDGDHWIAALPTGIPRIG